MLLNASAGENTINPDPFKAAFEGTPSTNRGEPGNNTYNFPPSLGIFYGM